MKPAVVVLVVLAEAVALVLGFATGFDTTAIVILVLTIVAGAFAIAVTSKAQFGNVGPAHCDTCGGVVSPNAPYCKHCGATL